MDKVTMANEKIRKKLYYEYNVFIDNLKTLSPEQIIEKAYEKVAKEDILSVFECNNALDYNQARVLLSMKNPLNYLYYEFLDTEISNKDLVSDCVHDAAKKAVKEIKEERQSEIASR